MARFPIAMLFADPPLAERVFEAVRWPDGRLCCPWCGFRYGYRMMRRQRPGWVHFKCGRCHGRYSSRRGTPLARSHLPTATWLVALALAAEDAGEGLPTRLAATLALNYRTAWSLARRLRAPSALTDLTRDLALERDPEGQVWALRLDRADFYWEGA